MGSINSVISQAVIANLLSISNAKNASVLNLTSGVKSNASVADFTVGILLASKSNVLSSANINAGKGKSLVATAQGALSQIQTLLLSQQSLAAQATDTSLSSAELANLNAQFQANSTEINRIANSTKFDNKKLLNGSISGTANLATATGQSTENYTLTSTSDFSLSGTTASGNLTTSSVFSTIATNSVGKTAGSATLSFVGAVGGVITNAVVQVGGQSITFSSGATDAAAATAFVAAAEASTNNTVRQFTYKDNGNGTVTVTGSDLGTSANTTTLALTNRGGNINADTVTFGSSNIDTVGAGAAKNLTTASSATLGTNRSALSATLDANLQGSLSGFTASLDATGTQNAVTFTVSVNGQTYTSQSVTLFGTGGYNSKGNTIKNGQVITFYNPSGSTDSNDEFTNNAFSLTIGGSDVTVSGGDSSAFQTSLTSIATGFGTQLASNYIDQSRSIILTETNATGGDYAVAAATGTTLGGIKSFNATEGANAKGDINFVGDTFGTDGNNSTVGAFSYNAATYTLSTTINGQVYSANLSSTAATLSAVTTEGLATGTGGSFNTSTGILTAGSSGTTIVFHSASTTNSSRLTLDLSNLTNKTIYLNTSSTQTAFTNDLNTTFGVASNQSLTFQVGTDSSNTIGVALGSATTSSIYKDSAGAGQSLNISTTDGATLAVSVLANSVNNILALQATASAASTSFISAIATNNISINNFDAASSTLLNTDYATESTLYAQNALRENAAISILAQLQSSNQNILKLLGS